MNKVLFENSTIEQWQTLASGEILKTPIKAKAGVKIVDIRYFLDGLKTNAHIVHNFLKLIEQQKAIFYNGKPITSKQLREATKSKAPILKTEIDDILNSM